MKGPLAREINAEVCSFCACYSGVRLEGPSVPKVQVIASWPFPDILNKWQSAGSSHRAVFTAPEVTAGLGHQEGPVENREGPGGSLQVRRWRVWRKAQVHAPWALLLFTQALDG